LAINLGWAVGASIGGLVAAFDYELLFWVDGITNILAAGLLFYFLRPNIQLKKEEVKEEEVPEVMSAYRDKTYLGFLVLMTLFSCCFVQLFTTIPKYFRDDMLLNEKYIGLIMAINGIIIVAIEMVLVYTLEKKNKNTRWIIIGLVMCACSYLSLLIPGNAKFISLMMILFITVGEIMAMPFMNVFWLQRANDKNRGQYAALYTISWGVGNTVGPFLISTLVDASSFKVAFIVLGFILFISAFGFYKLNSNSKT
jgi:predicted MFS family arabinose efflux permease